MQEKVLLNINTAFDKDLHWKIYRPRKLYLFRLLPVVDSIIGGCIDKNKKTRKMFYSKLVCITFIGIKR